ncbi:hypothetical protein E2C01_034624 [Portunus trituberculatus]|uniref:Uncharacterized protein n=1 Tax=Portunus trituberculatus TaxID=210409 RepID=A0A5B7F3B3_PORTR|nr:hypothetical protein [Portunus trituberculatus]
MGKRRPSLKRKDKARGQPLHHLLARDGAETAERSVYRCHLYQRLTKPRKPETTAPLHRLDLPGEGLVQGVVAAHQQIAKVVLQLVIVGYLDGLQLLCSLSEDLLDPLAGVYLRHGLILFSSGHEAGASSLFTSPRVAAPALPCRVT